MCYLTVRREKRVTEECSLGRDGSNRRYERLFESGHLLRSCNDCSKIQSHCLHVQGANGSGL